MEGPQQGSEFLHSRYRGAGGTPARCVVTMVGSKTIWYDVYDAPDRVSRVDAHVHVESLDTVVRKWLDKEDDAEQGG